MQHSTDFGCSANLASALRPAVSPRPAGGSRCAPRMPYPHDPAGMPPPVYWSLPEADRLRRNAAGYKAFRQDVDVVGSIRKLFVPHIGPKIWQHRIKVPAFIEPAVQDS